MRELHSVASINQSSNFNNLTVAIGDLEIKPELITEISFDFDGTFKVFGNITINDHYDIHTQGKLDINSTILITLIDIHDDTFAREFKVVSVSEEKMQDFKILKLSLQDIISYTLEKTFIPKSYEKTSLKKIFEDYLSLEVDALISGFPLTKKFKETRELTNFVVPENINFLDFMIIEFQKEGMFFYQTIYDMIIGDLDVAPGKYPYKQVGSEDLYGFNIMEYKLLTNNYNLINRPLPKTDWLVFDKSKKSMTHYDKSYDDYKNDMNIDPAKGVVKDLQVTDGVKLETKEYLLDDTAFKYVNYKDCNILSIVVPGNVKKQDLYSVVDISLAGNVLAEDTKNKGDEKLSGKYQIYRIEMKMLLGQKLVNKLTLKRTIEGKQT